MTAEEKPKAVYKSCASCGTAVHVMTMGPCEKCHEFVCTTCHNAGKLCRTCDNQLRKEDK